MKLKTLGTVQQIFIWLYWWGWWLSKSGTAHLAHHSVTKARTEKSPAALALIKNTSIHPAASSALFLLSWGDSASSMALGLLLSPPVCFPHLLAPHHFKIDQRKYLRGTMTLLNLEIASWLLPCSYPLLQAFQMKAVSCITEYGKGFQRYLLF